jgi:hypothetical protein
MLVRSCNVLCIEKAKTRNLEAFLGVVKSLGMSVTLMRLSIVVSHRTMRRPTCV